jgi:hypothetical protein
VARFYGYHDVVDDVPARAPDILRITGQIAALPAVRDGVAVLVGSAAWGTVSWRSDIDVMVYECDRSATLQADIDALCAAYTAATGGRHHPPKVDTIIVGAEHEQLVERDNLVSGSAAILEPRLVSEIFDRICVRLVDHVRALAGLKGEPWRSFAARYLDRTDDDVALRRDVLREYSASAAAGWRQVDWAASHPGAEPSDEQLAQFGHAEGFANHVTRLVLADLGVYPRPDRRADVRAALAQLGAPWGDEARAVLAPFFALTDHYEEAVANVLADPRRTTAEEFNTQLREAASGIDFDAVEEFVWRYAPAAPVEL